MGDLKFCPFCGSIRLDFQFRQAADKRHRHGRYDSAVYCRRCHSYGPRVRSEDIELPTCDTRNESPADRFKDAMRIAAVDAWNRRTE